MWIVASEHRARYDATLEPRAASAERLSSQTAQRCGRDHCRPVGNPQWRGDRDRISPWLRLVVDPADIRGSSGGESMTSDEPTYLIHRIEPPDWVVRADDFNGPYPAATIIGAEQPDWGYQIPSVYRILADPGASHTYQRAPRRGDEHWMALGYWTPLIHVLLYGLGWPRPSLGLKRWVDEGKPTGDPQLRLVRELWDSDGQLDWFLAWLPTAEYQVAAGLTELASIRIRWDSDYVHRSHRYRAVAAEAEESGIPNPISGGTDPLHLSSHCDGPIAAPDDTPSYWLSLNAEARRGSLVLDSMPGWYRTLAEIDLPDLGSRSWRIAVHTKDAGYLGTYRKSRESGLWFSGRHRYHSWGLG